MPNASLRTRIARLERQRAARPTPATDRVAEFERAFRALHVAVDPSKDPGGLPELAVEPPTKRWRPAKLGPDQFGYLHSKARINITACGRRSFKTEALKRRTVRAAIVNEIPDAWGYLSAPTHAQARKIFWEDVKALTPTWALRHQNRRRDIRESDLEIHYWNGARLRVFGLDVPERIEGDNWDFGGVTEFGNTKPGSFGMHIRPMLMRGGWCDIEGTPEGRNHYYELAQRVRSADIPNAAYHQWTTEEVLHLWLGRERAEGELAEAKKTLDAMVYRQEYLADWISFTGRAYYAFDRDVHAVTRLRYNPNLPLIVGFDFNKEPGVAVYVQELFVDEPRLGIKGWTTCVIGEVWIESNSNSRKVAERVVSDWKRVHRGEVHIYGDATGGAGGSAKVDGSDWDLVKSELRPWLGDRLVDCVPRSNPRERARVNAVNARLRAADGSIGLLVDPISAPHVVEDLDGVVVKPGGAGEIEKPTAGKKGLLTHISDALGYYVVAGFEVEEDG